MLRSSLISAARLRPAAPAAGGIESILAPAAGLEDAQVAGGGGAAAGRVSGWPGWAKAGA